MNNERDKGISKMFSPHVLLLAASLSVGIASLVATEFAGIATPLGILLSSFLTPMGVIGCIASAQHYFKRSSSSRFRTILLLTCFILIGITTIILFPSKGMSGGRLLYSILRLWWLSLLLICLGVLLRRSLLSSSSNDSISSTNGTNQSSYDVRKNSSDDEENNENTSLLGAGLTPVAMPKLSHFSYPLLFIPLLFAILSLVVPPFWTSDHNVSGNGVFGSFGVVLPFPMFSSIVGNGWIDLTFRYEIWLPFLSSIIILVTTQRSWSYLFSEIVTLVMLSVTCMMIILLHNYSDDARKWYCDMGTDACASATASTSTHVKVNIFTMLIYICFLRI